MVYFLQILQLHLSWQYVILSLSLSLSIQRTLQQLIVKFEHLHDATRTIAIIDLHWIASRQAHTVLFRQRHVNPTHRLPHASLSALLASSHSRVTASSLGLLTHSKSLLNTKLKKVTTFLSNASRCPMTTAFWKVPRLCPSVLLGGTHICEDEYGALVE